MEKTKGYLVVASKTQFFYSSAINLIESLKDFYPDANVCLVTEPKFLDGREEVADVVIHCDDHSRAKLKGMAQSPYDLTMYIDADCVIEHEDIEHVFEEMGDYDVMFTGLPADRHYCYAEVYFPGGTKPDGSRGGFELCGGVCLYDMSKPIVREFMNDWYDLTVEQYSNRWWPTKEDGTPDYDLYPQSFKRWDQFSLWWLTNKEEKYKDLKVGIFEDDARWNWYNNYLYEHNKNPIVIRHFSSTQAKKVIV